MSSEVDPRLASASAQRGLIPTKEQLEIEQSAVPGIAGMILPFEFIYCLSYIVAMDVNMALLSFIALFATILVGYIYPAQKRVAAKDKAGIPVRERNQLGSHMWEEQNRYIAVIPAVKPIKEVDKTSIFSIYQERNKIAVEMGGKVIIEGLPIDPAMIKQARDMLADAEEALGESTTIGKIRVVIKTGFQIAKEVLKLIMLHKRAFILGSAIAFLIYLFSPLWTPWWYTLLTMIGW